MKTTLLLTLAIAVAACSSASPTSVTATPTTTGSSSTPVSVKITISGANAACPVFTPNIITISAGQYFYFENTTAYTEPLLLSNYGPAPIFTLGPTEFSPMIYRTIAGTYEFHVDGTTTSQGGSLPFCGEDQYAHVLVGP